MESFISDLGQLSYLRPTLVTLLLGCMGMLVTITRASPPVKEFLRLEGLMGRFVQQNILPLSWIERMLQVEFDDDNKNYTWLLKNILQTTPYQDGLTISSIFE